MTRIGNKLLEGAAGVEAARKALVLTRIAILPLVPCLDALGGIAATIHAPRG